MKLEIAFSDQNAPLFTVSDERGGSVNCSDAIKGEDWIRAAGLCRKATVICEQMIGSVEYEAGAMIGPLAGNLGRAR